MLVTLLVLVCLPAVVYGHSSNAKLLLVSLDGFRHDYFEIAAEKGFPTPNLDKLRAQGAFAKVQNVFLTKTAPSHYSIATGLNPVHHGVVHNIFNDPVYGETCDMRMQKEYKWFNGTDPARTVEPIWITNQKAKHTLFPRRSGVYLWPGSEVSFQNHLPVHFAIETDDTSFLPFEVRAQSIVNWFANEEAPINFGILYMPEPDHTGHFHGTHSNETLKKIAEIDKGIGELVSLLEEHELFEHMNIIITSDHGMADVEHDVVYLDKYLGESSITIIGDNVASFIIPEPNDEATRDQIYQKLKEVPDGINVYLADEIPEKFHFRHSRRIMPILIVAKLGWLFADRQRENSTFTVADHGYDNAHSEMHPFLLATGPAFKTNYTSSDLVNQIDLYELMCHILGIEPNPNDGDLDRIEHLLENDEEEAEGEYTILTLLAVMVLTALVSGVFCVAACRVYRVNIRHRRRYRHLQAFPPKRLDMTTTTTLLAESEEEIP